MKDTIMLIDGHNMLWRANMSWGKDKNDKSNHVMIYNFFRNLRPLVEQFSPTKIFFVMEGHPKHRHEIYSEYKANRIIKTASKQETHDKFHLDKKEIIRLLKYLPVTICKAGNYEADDVIATLAENLKEENVIIISNDTDYIQLLQKGFSSIKIYNPVRKSFVEAPSYLYLAWKSLRGDPSDNIPGLMSDAKAEKLVKTPSLLREWMELEENRANFSINRSLIEFAKVPEEEILIEEGHANFNSLKEEFIKMEFLSLIKDSTWNKFCQTFNCLKF
jgi:5'-3' exonuclease